MYLDAILLLLHTLQLQIYTFMFCSCDFPLEFCQTLDIVKAYIVKEEEATLLAPNLIIAVWQKQFPPPISVINHQKTVCGRTSALFAVVTAEAINKGTARL